MRIILYVLVLVSQYFYASNICGNTSIIVGLMHYTKKQAKIPCLKTERLNIKPKTIITYGLNGAISYNISKCYIGFNAEYQLIHTSLALQYLTNDNIIKTNLIHNLCSKNPKETITLEECYALLCMINNKCIKIRKRYFYMLGLHIGYNITKKIFFELTVGIAKSKCRYKKLKPIASLITDNIKNLWDNLNIYKLYKPHSNSLMLRSTIGVHLTPPYSLAMAYSYNPRIKAHKLDFQLRSNF